MGTLERLQKSVTEYLRGIGDLRFADISAEKLEKDLSEKAEGLKVLVLSPIPQRASKYAAGPTFSAVALSIAITQDNAVANYPTSLITSAEIISRALHFWTPPIESGYGKLSLSESSPWQRVSDNTICITFNTQSVLQ